MLSKPGILLRIEGAALFALCMYGYQLTGAGWGLFLLLFLWLDLFMLGYLGNVRLGATLYNLAHVEALPVLLRASRTHSTKRHCSIRAHLDRAHCVRPRTRLRSEVSDVF